MTSNSTEVVHQLDPKCSQKRVIYGRKVVYKTEKKKSHICILKPIHFFLRLESKKINKQYLLRINIKYITTQRKLGKQFVLRTCYSGFHDFTDVLRIVWHYHHRRPEEKGIRGNCPLEIFNSYILYICYTQIKSLLYKKTLLIILYIIIAPFPPDKLLSIVVYSFN